MPTLKVLAFITLAIGGWIAYQLLIAYPDITVRYRIEAQFEYQGNLVSASSVWEVEYQSHNTYDGMLRGLSTYHGGEAAVVELPDKAILFVRVDGPEISPYRDEMRQWNFPDRIPLKLLNLERSGHVETVQAIAKMAKEGRSLSFSLDLLPKIWILRSPDDLDSFYRPQVCKLSEVCELRFVKGQITFVDEMPQGSLAGLYPWMMTLKGAPSGAPLEPGQEFPSGRMFIRSTP